MNYLITRPFYTRPTELIPLSRILHQAFQGKRRKEKTRPWMMVGEMLASLFGGHSLIWWLLSHANFRPLQRMFRITSWIRLEYVISDKGPKEALFGISCLLCSSSSCRTGWLSGIPHAHKAVPAVATTLVSGDYIRSLLSGARLN